MISFKHGMRLSRYLDAPLLVFNGGGHALCAQFPFETNTALDTLFRQGDEWVQRKMR